MAIPETFLLLGRDYGAYGAMRVVAAASGTSAAAISVGADEESPSFAFKGDPASCPNEDGLLLVDEGRRVLLAVADGHHGEEAGHRRLLGLANAVAERGLPDGVDGLLAAVRGLGEAEPPTQPSSGTTFLVAILDRAEGRGAVVSWGDSSLASVGPDGEVRISIKLGRYVTASEELVPEQGFVSDFRTEPGCLLLAFTDGIDECHYGNPRSSVRGRHRADLFRQVGAQPAAYAERLARLALDGVRGYPGGQDNLALVVARS